MKTARRKRNTRVGPRLAILATASMAVLALLAQPAVAQELRVVVSPGTADVLPGAAISFTAEVRDGAGAVVGANVMWSVIPPRAGSIGASGRFVAGESEGRAVVRAVAVLGSASGTGHAVVQIGEGSAPRLAVSITPESASVARGETRRFSARVTDPFTGSEVEAELRWVALPDNVGHINQNGLFTAGDFEMSGRIAARATLGGREGVADATVVVGSPPGPDVRVTVVPPYALLEPGDETRFEAIVTGVNGNAVDIDVAWSVMPARLGVVDANGSFTAGPDEAVGKLVATVATVDGPARGFAGVEIRSAGPAGVRVRVRPREAAVLPGGDVQFEAIVEGPGAEPLDVPVEWTVRPEWIGSINRTGIFTASDEMPDPSSGGVWMGAVVASIETSSGVASDAARVIVRDGGPAMKLRVYPHSPIVAPGQDVQFETKVIGAEEPLDWTTEWAVFPEDLGTITPDGLFTANPAYENPASDEFGPHEGVIGARATLDSGSMLSGRAHVQVRVQGQPVRVMVRPAFAVVPPSGSMEFEAVVLGPDGQDIGIPVTWNIAPQHIGHISPDGVFTASDLNVDANSWQRPHGTIVAEARVGNGGVFRGSAAVVIDLPNPELTVRLSPKSVTVAEGESFQFTAEVFTTDGDPVDLPLEWRVSDSLVGMIDPSGLFTATESLPQGQSRRTTVLAGAEYNGRVYWDHATVRISGS